MAAYRATGGRLYLPYALALQAEACREAGRPAEGLDLLAEAFECARAHGLRRFEPELHRCAAELLLSLPEPDLDEAAARLGRATAAARAQGAKLCELQGATRLARLLRDQGRRAEARDLLAPVCGWFTEGLDTPDLAEGRALLEELDPAPLRAPGA